MHKKRFKLIYFSLGGSESKEISLNWPKIISFLVIFFVLAIVSVYAILRLFTDVYHNARIAHLDKQNSEMLTMLTEWEKRVDQIEDKIKMIEQEDGDLRTYVDLPQVDADIKQMGQGGLSSETFSMYDNSTDETFERALKTNRVIKDLNQRMVYFLQSREEIEVKFNANLDSLRRIPSIRPVRGGFYSSYFGWRIHPIIDKKKFHYGLDISVPRGTDVYAPADGVVTRVVNHYQPNTNYGKMIEIDHGNDKSTIFGHLNRIMVKPGQKVTRWSVIGKVGSTGRSTAPHLHYEVRESGEPVNPLRYIFEE